MISYSSFSAIIYAGTQSWCSHSKSTVVHLFHSIPVYSVLFWVISSSQVMRWHSLVVLILSPIHLMRQMNIGGPSLFFCWELNSRPLGCNDPSYWRRRPVASLFTPINCGPSLLTVTSRVGSTLLWANGWSILSSEQILGVCLGILGCPSIRIGLANRTQRSVKHDILA